VRALLVTVFGILSLESLPTGISDRASLEEDAVLGAREGSRLVGVDPATLDDLAGGDGSGRVVPAVFAHTHGHSLAAAFAYGA